MISLLNICLGFFVVAGVAAGVAVPLAMKSRGNSSDSSAQGGAASPISTVSLDACSTGSAESGTAVTFGAESVNSVCWRVSDNGSDTSVQEEVGKALGTSWGTSSFSNLGGQGWTVYCETQQGSGSSDSSSGGVLGQSIMLSKGNNNQQCSGTAYLKFGEQSQTYLKKKKENNNSTTKVWLCNQDCFNGFDDHAVAQPVTEKQEGWKELQFYNKGQSQ